MHWFKIRALKIKITLPRPMAGMPLNIGRIDRFFDCALQKLEFLPHVGVRREDMLIPSLAPQYNIPSQRLAFDLK